VNSHWNVDAIESELHVRQAHAQASFAIHRLCGIAYAVELYGSSPMEAAGVAAAD
jgi:hypothetical protein